MKKYLAAAAGGLLIVAAQAQGGREPAPEPVSAPRVPKDAEWGHWTRPLGTPGAAPVAAPPQFKDGPIADAADIDVVDSHWMALTMWGEARNQGEEGMRAVGHVIYNRWQAQGRYGAYVTDTVSQAFQFSCWNEGDPNRAAMLNIGQLPKSSEDHRLWLAAKRLANEILSGRSEDPTGGALFYHTADARPKWSRGIEPVSVIGRHLFFASAAGV